MNHETDRLTDPVSQPLPSPPDEEVSPSDLPKAAGGSIDGKQEITLETQLRGAQAAYGDLLKTYETLQRQFAELKEANKILLRRSQGII